MKLALLLVALCAVAPLVEVTAMISKSGHYVPPELRRDRELNLVSHKRTAIQKKLETAEGNELLDLQNQLLALEQEELSHTKGIEEDAKLHHDLRQAKNKVMEGIHAETEEGEAKDALHAEMRAIERKHAEIRLRHLGMSRGEMDEHHRIREELQDLRSKLKYEDHLLSAAEKDDYRQKVESLAERLRENIATAMRKTHQVSEL